MVHQSRSIIPQSMLQGENYCIISVWSLYVSMRDKEQSVKSSYKYWLVSSSLYT